jgi:hypothetical protein
MKNFFEPPQRCGISERLLPEQHSIDPAGLRLDPRKRGRNGRNGGPRRRQQSVNRHIRIKLRHPEAPQYRRCGALTHTDRASKAKNNQGGARVATIAARSSGVTRTDAPNQASNPGRP